MLKSLRGAMFSAAARSPLSGWVLPVYRFQFTPADLCILVNAVDETEGVDGSLLEVGCYQGATTVFLNEHLRAQGSDKRYFAIDTFSGFRPEDIDAERRRGRTSHPYSNFRRNSLGTFRRTMRRNGIDRVTAIQTDAKSFDFRSVGPFSFCLVDVDLYAPVLATLDAVYPLMSPGGVILVDDCDPESDMWRGAYEAYRDFVTARGLPVEIRSKMLGQIRC